MGCGWTRCRISSNARDQQREPARNACHPEGIRAEVDAHYPDACCSPKLTSGPKTGPISAMATNAMPFHFPRCRACTWRSRKKTASDHRHHAANAGNSRNCQWAIFLRNHDELTLEMVTDKERDYL
jgi:maltose alpha-D-glucosyltransferase/alpha-amylase